MSRIGKAFVLFLTVIMVMSCLILLTVKTASAQSITVPSVPQFTVKFADLSYDVPTTTTVNQYNGQTITNQGYHEENRTIQLTIKNQPFTSYIQNGANISFYFNVREKGAYAQNWTTLYNPNYYFPTQSNAGYTTLVYLIDQNAPPFWDDFVNGGIVEFQVQALIGFVHRGYNASATNPLEMYPWIFDGQTSNWSNTQTITVPASSSSPTPGPTVPGLSWLVIVPLLFSVLAVALVLRHRKP